MIKVAMTTPKPGSTIAERYVVLAPLGEGGMGQVVRARDSKLDREVAVKVLAAHAVGDAKARERLVREARAAAKLAHAGIVHVYDVGETDDGGAFLVMELVRGATLRARLERGSVGAEEAIKIVIECARALAFAHRAGSVHRDVKPDNVMIRDDGRAAMLDFGIAKSITANAPTLTDAGMVVGTPAYLAPEQARGEEIDGRADQFALAVTAYEALTGKTPWTAASSAAVIAEILRDDPPAPSTIAKGLPIEVDRVLGRAMQKKASDRYADLDAFADALQEIIAKLGAKNTSVPASLARTEAIPTTGSQPIEAARATRRWVWTTPIAVVLVAAAVFLFPRLFASKNAATQTPTPTAQPTAITDLPLPTSSSPDAIAAYRAGIQATRDGDAAGVARGFKRATELDPSMGAAWMRLADISFAQGNIDLAREALNHALAQRTTLTPRDLAVVGTFEPLILRASPDFAEYRRRVTEVVAKYPLDADALAELAGADFYAGDFVATEVDARRALALDPRFAMAWIEIAFAAEERNDPVAVANAYASCLDVARTATTCLSNVMLGEASRGECAKYDAHAADALALTPETPFPYLARAYGLARNHAPLETLRASSTSWGRDKARCRSAPSTRAIRTISGQATSTISARARPRATRRSRRSRTASRKPTPRMRWSRRFTNRDKTRKLGASPLPSLRSGRSIATRSRWDSVAPTHRRMRSRQHASTAECRAPSRSSCATSGTRSGPRRAPLASRGSLGRCSSARPPSRARTPRALSHRSPTTCALASTCGTTRRAPSRSVTFTRSPSDGTKPSASSSVRRPPATCSMTFPASCARTSSSHWRTRRKATRRARARSISGSSISGATPSLTRSRPRRRRRR
jgi:serine/threonine-protein kinase